MATINFDYHPQFFTATIPEWKHLLKEGSYKDIIINSLQFLKNEQSVVIYGYVIMPNHIHLLWQVQDGFKQDKIQMRFLKFTAQQMKFKLQKENPLWLDNAGQRLLALSSRAPLTGNKLSGHNIKGSTCIIPPAVTFGTKAITVGAQAGAYYDVVNNAGLIK